MSANNWGTCPMCKANTEKKAESAYGVVPEEEYLELIKNKAEYQQPSLAEYYEIWTDEEGKFFVSYSCICSVCGFDFKFKHSQMLAVDATR